MKDHLNNNQVICVRIEFRKYALLHQTKGEKTEKMLLHISVDNYSITLTIHAFLNN